MPNGDWLFEEYSLYDTCAEDAWEEDESSQDFQDKQYDGGLPSYMGNE